MSIYTHIIVLKYIVIIKIKIMYNLICTKEPQYLRSTCKFRIFVCKSKNHKYHEKRHEKTLSDRNGSHAQFINPCYEPQRFRLYAGT